MTIFNLGNIGLDDIPWRFPLSFASRKIRGHQLFIVILGLEILLGAVLWHPLKSAAEAENVNETALLTVAPTVQGNSLLPTANLATVSPDTKQTLVMVVTAYSSTPGETDGDPHITASGKYVRPGIVANNMLPLGTKVRLPEIYGDKIFTVEDRMNSRKDGYQIDIWFPSYWEAKRFGVKRTYVEILEG